jgi:hypothetical protein
MSKQEVNTRVCIFCFRPYEAEMTHLDLPFPIPVCMACARKVNKGKLTVKDAKMRLWELEDMDIVI